MNGKKLERPLFLDMPADEALARFIQTKPEEVEAPPGKSRKRPRATSKAQPQPPESPPAARPADPARR